MRRDLTGQVIIITGASSGIGAATAIACAKAGMDVVINARRADKLKQVADEVKRIGRSAEIVVGDVAEPGISERMLDRAMTRFGRFDAVFANAGYGFDRAMHELKMEDLRAMFEVNFFAGVDLLKRAADRLIAAKRPGHLLMCSSCLAKFFLPYAGPYCATKAAQNMICRAMRLELRPHGINVASVHPVGTDTEFFAASAKRSGPADEAHVASASPPRYFLQSPMKVANAVVRCLRRPKPEVWTSFSVRLAAAMMLVFPRTADTIMSRADHALSRMAKK